MIGNGTGRPTKKKQAPSCVDFEYIILNEFERGGKVAKSRRAFLNYSNLSDVAGLDEAALKACALTVRIAIPKAANPAARNAQGLNPTR